MAQVNLSMQQKQTHRHREQTCGCQEGGGWGRDGVGAYLKNAGKKIKLGAKEVDQETEGWFKN